MSKTSRYFVITVLVLLVCVSFLGCKKKEIISSVSGKVTYNGNPFGDGSIQFVNPSTGVSGIAYMDESGNYKFVSPVPIGEYKVIIGGYAPLPPGEVDKRKMPNYPAKYKSAGTTEWSYTIVKGENIANFDMVD